MTKVRCKYCEKCVDGKCSAKKNESVKLTKKRVCHKYSQNTEAITEDLDKVKNNKIPMHRNTFRYYEKEWAKASKMQKRDIGDSTLTTEDLIGPDTVQVR